MRSERIKGDDFSDSLVKIKELKREIVDTPFMRQKLQSFYDELEKVNQSLEFLKFNNVKYDLGLVGGSIRDLIFGNVDKVKDLDILISIEQQDGSAERAMRLCKNLYGKEYANFLQENAIDITNDMELDQRLATDFLVTRLIGMHEPEFEKFINNKGMFNKGFSDGVSEDSYASKYFLSVIKVKKDKYPMDLILTNIDIKTIVNYYFDFNICKTVLFHNDGKRPVDNLFISPLAYKDFENQTLTFDYRHYSLSEATAVMENHYPRLLEKFPFKLEWWGHIEDDILSPSAIGEESRQIEYMLERFVQKELLEKSIPKAEESKTKKYKI